jgi:SAM-dependent methyltransferase
MSASAGLAERGKTALRRWPRVYGALHASYYRTLFLAEKCLLGTKIHELNWASKQGWSDEEIARMAAHPHRAYLADRLARWSPVTSVLEVGCNAGPNLMQLAQRLPEAALIGIDINARAIEAGQRWAAREGVSRFSIHVGRADDLRSFADRSIDVTFSDATLMYLGPDKIGEALREMIRVTKKAVVLNEWSLDCVENDGRSVWHYLRWLHSFRTIFAAIAPGQEVTVTKLPPELWGPDGWREYGTLIELRLSE